ncbi:hypothetical protein [Actinomadura rudentiformis]|uniref:Uncharacterized protein n=1 Tax=Actinomadura rudentiformis TaxID=359158 RepID=A0A6H9YMX6_9ACTN|nr:hypothetical protein [Actinomadura rudentiformis]KAB2347352.1 hypothetical protein F8566_20280 [Actinomadura rudentiformis]
MAIKRIPVRLKDDPTTTTVMAERSLLVFGHLWEPIPDENDTGEPETPQPPAETPQPPAETPQRGKQAPPPGEPTPKNAGATEERPPTTAKSRSRAAGTDGE